MKVIRKVEENLMNNNTQTRLQLSHLGFICFLQAILRSNTQAPAEKTTLNHPTDLTNQLLSA